MTHVQIIGAGVAGLCCAAELVDRGFHVSIYERSEALGSNACSWWAGGMLAPWCEEESAESMVVDLGKSAADWWQDKTDIVSHRGSLVVSPRRDAAELRRFADLTREHQWLDGAGPSELEPDLDGRFQTALFFSREAHLDPRKAIAKLANRIEDKGSELVFDREVTAAELDADVVVDCRGFAARDHLEGLRGVKGEMLILRSDELQFTRPIRLLHPRHPMYLVPRGDGHYMLGATMIENSERTRFSVLSMLELLNAAYALHPALAEAEIVETGVDVRPAFRDNLPALSRRDNVIYVNGLFRHGYLLAPSMARQVADSLEHSEGLESIPLCASF